MVTRGALGIRVPRAQARRVATPSELIDLNQGVRVPWTVPITWRIVYTLIKWVYGHELETFRSTSLLGAQIIKFTISVIFYIKKCYSENNLSSCYRINFYYYMLHIIAKLLFSK